VKLKQMPTMQFGAAGIALLLSITANAADLILLTDVTSASTDGDPEALRETGKNGCRYVGKFRDTTHTATSWVEPALVADGDRLSDWSIEMSTKGCNGAVSPISAVVGLSKAHIYSDIADGKIRRGYRAGDRVGSTVSIQAPTH
jgi:hypothetical protein